MYYLFAQTAHGEGLYGASTYGGETTETVGGQDGGLIDTGSPVFWGSIVSLSLIIAIVLTLLTTARPRRKQQ